MRVWIRQRSPWEFRRVLDQELPEKSNESSPSILVYLGDSNITAVHVIIFEMRISQTRPDVTLDRVFYAHVVGTGLPIVLKPLGDFSDSQNHKNSLKRADASDASTVVG
jgi:hypothetical protein